MNKIAVSIKNVKKVFKIPHEKEDSLKLHAINKLRGKYNNKYDEYRALRGINLDIQKGDFIGIMGRNGAGKSTLLKIIADIYQPSSGSIKVSGKLVPFIELGVGFNPNLSGRDNVYLNGAMLGFSKNEVDKIYEEIVAFAELEEFMDQKLKNYSSGMQVRLAFSLAIRADADILLLDEVLAVGDAAFQRKCYEYFDSLKESNKTIILVSHSVGVMRKYCNRGVLIEGGKVTYDGDVTEATEKYLDLFGTEHRTSEKNSGDELDGEVRINKVESKCDENDINIDVEIESRTDKEDLKIAVRILDLHKKVVAGINTQSVTNPVLISLKGRKAKLVRFNMPNILGNGVFSLDIRVGPNVYTGIIHDHVSGVANFVNSKDEVYYPVAMPASVEVSAK